MSELEAYKDLCKKQGNLLRKDFYFGSLFLVKFGIARGAYKFSGRLSENEPGASYPLYLSGWQEYTKEEWSLKAKKASDGSLRIALDLSPKKYQNLKVKAQYRQVSGNPSIGFEYLHSKARANCEVTCGSAHCNLVFGSKKLGFGAEGLVDYNTLKPSLTSLACWWVHKHSRLVLKHENVDSNTISLGKFDISLYQKVDSNTKFAASAKIDCVGKALDIEAGGENKWDATTTGKWKIDSSGKIALALKKQWSDALTSVLSAETSSETLKNHAFRDTKFGIRLNINQ